MVANFKALGPAESPQKYQLGQMNYAEELSLLDRSEQQALARDAQGPASAAPRFEGKAARDRIQSLFGGDMLANRKNKVQLNKDINLLAVEVVDHEEEFRLVYRGGTATENQALTIMGICNGRNQVTDNETFTHSLFHGENGLEYPPSFSTDKDVADDYCAVDKKNWPTYVRTVMYTVKAYGPMQDGDTPRMGVLGTTVREHARRSRNELILDNRNRYRMVKCKEIGMRLEVEVIALGPATPPPGQEPPAPVEVKPKSRHPFSRLPGWGHLTKKLG